MKESAVKKILVIEEQDAVRNLFLEGLRTRGFEAIGAANGRTGIQKARDHLPDLITCGLVMAKPDGFAVLQTLRESPATAIIPLIFVTVKMTRSDLHKAMELGASGYLTKPCTIEELMGTITAQLERQSLLHQRYTGEGRSPMPPLLPASLSSSPSQPIESYGPPLSEVFRFITTNYHRPIALSDVAQAVGYSPAYLTHLMGQQTGQTIRQWIIRHRMAAACSLLLETDQTVEQIASQVGYHHAVHFFRQFRRLYGKTPQAWRNEHHQSF
ncbi:MAG: DNA-binding response regulator [Synechococcales bacterium]|nr:DNA-binding response regulator [Synechococcales bacterium]